MNLSQYPRFLLTIVTALCLVYSIASAQRMEEIQPKEYISPSGTYRLHVDPSHRYGKGKAMYRLTHKGAEVWAGELPFTLWEAGVDDQGIVGGYAYSHGKSLRRDNSDFRVVILDRQGAVQLEQVTKREPSRFIHASDYPLAAGLLFDSANDRMIVRLLDADLSRGIEKWWVYRLSTAKPAGSFEPQSLMTDSGRSHSILQSRLIPNTNLILLHWWVVQLDINNIESGARFTLIDVDGKPVWTLDLPVDYTRPKDEKAQDNLREEIWKSGAILNITPTSEFTLWLATENKRVTYALRKDLDQAWKVTETSRQPYVPQATKQDQLPVLPKLSLKHIGSVNLRTHIKKSTNPIRDIREFVVDGKGRIAFLRNEANDDRVTFVCVTSEGKVVREIPIVFEASKQKTWPYSHLVWVGGDRYVITLSSKGIGATANAMWVDASTGQITPIQGFKCPSVDKLAGFSDGRFVLLATVHEKYTMSSTAYLYDAQGKLIHLFPHDNHTDPSSLFSPQDIAITSDGNIIVLDAIRANVAIFASNGTYRKTIDLAKSWKRKPKYVTCLSADKDGGFIIGDFRGQPAIIRMTARGDVIKEFDAKFANGSSTQSMQEVRVDSSGKMWTTDGTLLLALNEDGIVEKVLGETPTADHLGEIGTMKVDSRGRIYAVDKRSAAVHVFDPNGKPLHTCLPQPNDFEINSTQVDLSVADTGDVFLRAFGEASRFLHFSPEGKRLGHESLFESKGDSSSMFVHWVPRPSNEGRWAVYPDGIHLIEKNGKVIKSIERSPEGKWLQLIYKCAMAPDGALAVLIFGFHERNSFIKIHWYDKNGRPQRTLDMSLPGESFVHFDFDGDLFAISHDNRILLATASGRYLGSFDIPQAKGTDSSWTPFLIPKQKQLWLFDGVDTIHRFSLP